MCSALVPSRGLCRIFAYRTRHTQCAAEGHERLLLKLNRCGIDGQLQLLFRNFLTNRKKKKSTDTWIVFRMVACYIWRPSRLNTGADYVPYLRERHTSHLPPSYLLTIPKSIER